MADTTLLDSYGFELFNNSLNHFAVLLDTHGYEFHKVDFYTAMYAEINPDFAFCYCMTEPQYINKAVACFNLCIMERFFNWMEFEDMIDSRFDKEQSKYILQQYKASTLFRKLIGVNHPEIRVVITIWHAGSSEVD